MFRCHSLLPSNALDQEVQKCLCQLIGLSGFLTDPNIPGTEKLVVCAVDDKWLTGHRMWMSAAELSIDSGEKLLPPHTVFAVKGFNRSVCGLLVLLAAYEMPLLMEAGSQRVFARELWSSVSIPSQIESQAMPEEVIEHWP